jgi:hypothetical protein
MPTMVRSYQFLDRFFNDAKRQHENHERCVPTARPIGHCLLSFRRSAGFMERGKLFLARVVLRNLRLVVQDHVQQGIADF